MDRYRLIVQMAIGGFAVGVFLIAFAFATGSTFGQRCAKIHPEKGEAWRQCIDRLSRGKHE